MGSASSPDDTVQAADLLVGVDGLVLEGQLLLQGQPFLWVPWTFPPARRKGLNGRVFGPTQRALLGRFYWRDGTVIVGLS